MSNFRIWAKLSIDDLTEAFNFQSSRNTLEEKEQDNTMTICKFEIQYNILILILIEHWFQTKLKSTKPRFLDSKSSINED